MLNNMADYYMQWFALIWTLIYLGDVVRTADIPYMDRTIRFRFSRVRNHFVDPDVKDLARDFIYEEFRRFGLETEHNHFQYVDVTKNLSGTFSNVVGLMKGERFGTVADRIIAIGAHYDTVRTSNGVDDNGAGVAAMLEAARQLTRMKVTRNNTIIFVSFDLEEYGLIGSEQFIATWVNPWLVKHYGLKGARAVVPHGVIVLDTMMEYNTSEFSQSLPDAEIMKELWPDTYKSLKSDSFRGDFLTLIYRNKTLDDPLAGAFKTAWDISGRDQFELEPLAVPWETITSFEGDAASLFGNLLRSDHVSFWNDNIPSIFISDSANFRGDMKQCYHQMCDNVETMLTEENIQFLGKTADTITRTVNLLSEPMEINDTSGVERTAFSNFALWLALLSFAVTLS